MNNKKEPVSVGAEHPAAISQLHPISSATKSQIRTYKDAYNLVDPEHRYINLCEEQTDDGKEMMKIMFLEADAAGDFVYDRISDVYFVTADTDTSDYIRQILERMVRA